MRCALKAIAFGLHIGRIRFRENTKRPAKKGKIIGDGSRADNAVVLAPFRNRHSVQNAKIIVFHVKLWPEFWRKS